MKVAILMTSASRKAAGVFSAEKRLSIELSAIHGLDLQVFAVEDEYSENDRAEWVPVEPRLFRPGIPRSFGRGIGLFKALKGYSADILHTKGLWLYPSFAALRWRNGMRRPYLVSPHGMLDPWALRNSAMKKRFARLLYEDAHLKGAACIHAVSESEVASIRNIGLRNPVCLVPYGVHVPTGSSGEPPPWEGQIGNGQKVLLFLGRLHPKKGIGELLTAWKCIDRTRQKAANGWELVVAGWGEIRHENMYRSMVNALSIPRVHFLGPVYDEQKTSVFEHADGFVLPSFSEGLPVAVLEAMAHGLPVLMTVQCNLPEGFKAGAAVEVEPVPQTLARKLDEFFALTDAKRKEMGARGCSLMAKKFCWKRAAKDMKDVYEWVSEKRSVPGTVSLVQGNTI